MEEKRYLKTYLLVIFVVMVFVLPVFSDDQISSLSKKTTEKEVLDIFSQSDQVPTLGEVTLKMGVSLVIVMVLIGAVILLIKKFYPETIRMKEAHLKLVKVIEKTVISPRQAVYLIWAVDRLLLVGMNAGQMVLLSEIKDPGTLESKMPDEFSDTLTKANLKFSEIYNA